MSLTYLQNRHNGFDSGWTQERIEFLKQLWTEGWSASQIANKFRGVAFTRCAVIGKARRLKLEPRAPRQPRRHKANGVPKPPMPPPRPRPPPPPPPVAPRMRQLAFFKLKPHHCRWPLGEVLEPARLFCAADKDAGEIYCPFHRRMARVRAQS
jgi:GcrA cell cycle regulator